GPWRGTGDAWQTVAIGPATVFLRRSRTRIARKTGGTEKENSGSRLLAPWQNPERKNVPRQIPHRRSARRDRSGLPSLHRLFASVRFSLRTNSAARLPRHTRAGRTRL